MSNKNSFITQAFKQFGEMLDEELEIDGVKEVPVYEADTDSIHDFLDTAGEDESVDVIDLEAETVEDLKQSYVGKVVLDCNVCHSNIFLDKDEVVVDENGVANVDMECPYCISNEGYTVIGKITPFEEDEPEETEHLARASRRRLLQGGYGPRGAPCDARLYHSGRLLGPGPRNPFPAGL